MWPLRIRLLSVQMSVYYYTLLRLRSIIHPSSCKTVSKPRAERRQRTFPKSLVGNYGIFPRHIASVPSLVVFVAVVVQTSVHAVRVVSEGALRLQQLELLVQEVQRVVAR